jgi:(E)-4-hydroxy-3-methylbut-2-enyl-diphosphate synthase
VILEAQTWEKMDAAADQPNEWQAKYFPIYDAEQFALANHRHAAINFVMMDCNGEALTLEDVEKLQALGEHHSVVLCLLSTNKNAMQSVRSMFAELGSHFIKNPVILITDSHWTTPDEHLVHFATEDRRLITGWYGRWHMPWHEFRSLPSYDGAPAKQRSDFRAKLLAAPVGRTIYQ